MAGTIAFANAGYDDLEHIQRDVRKLASVRNIQVPKRITYFPYLGLICYTTNAIRDLMIEAAAKRGVTVERIL